MEVEGETLSSKTLLGMFGLGFNRGMIWHDGYLKLVSQSFYLGTRVIVGRFPDR